MIDSVPREILLDAGPIIGVVDVRDEHHDVAARGFQQLIAAHTRLVAPVPILFEVYKRIVYDVNPDSARQALGFMLDGFEIDVVDEGDLMVLHRLVSTMPWWDGSLEDAALALIGIRRELPVWTFNYRDLQAFPNLQFWAPG